MAFVSLFRVHWRVRWWQSCTGLCLGLPLLLGGCVADSEAPVPEAAQPPEAEVVAPTEAEADLASESLEPGYYCYGIDSDTLTGVVRLTVADNQVVTGDSNITIHNEPADYYSSYVQQLDGLLYEDGISMNVRTWIEYDVQESQEVWQITPAVLQTEQATLTEISCDVAQDPWLGPDGLLEAADLLEAPTVLHTQRVQFEAGSTSATVENAVVRGERDLYLLNAQGGQIMTLAITALEDNAAFDVITPSGLILEREATESELLLPHTGDYQILVGGTRGNASYTLAIQIE